MPASSSFDDFVPGGLTTLGIEFDETDLAVLRVAHGIWWPAIQDLLEADLSDVTPDPLPDLSRGPSE